MFLFWPTVLAYVFQTPHGPMKILSVFSYHIAVSWCQKGLYSNNLMSRKNYFCFKSSFVSVSVISSWLGQHQFSYKQIISKGSSSTFLVNVLLPNKCDQQQNSWKKNQERETRRLPTILAADVKNMPRNQMIYLK